MMQIPTEAQIAEIIAALPAEAAYIIRALASQRDRMKDALIVVAKWELPDTGLKWDESGEPVSDGACYGSNVERDYMRAIAYKALQPLCTGRQFGILCHDDCAEGCP